MTEEQKSVLFALFLAVLLIGSIIIVLVELDYYRYDPDVARRYEAFRIEQKLKNHINDF